MLLRIILDAAATGANQDTLIIVAGITACTTVSTAVITGLFTRSVRRVEHITLATHAIVNHDRSVLLESQAQQLRIASLDHPTDIPLRQAAERAEKAAADARESNVQPPGVVGVVVGPAVLEPGSTMEAAPSSPGPDDSGSE